MERIIALASACLALALVSAGVTVHEAGHSFHAWTIDDPATAAEAFARGADTVTTNRAKYILDATKGDSDAAKGGTDAARARREAGKPQENAVFSVVFCH